MALDNDYRFLSEPVELNWLGWKTDTATLAKWGWDISAQQDIAHQMMRIAIRKQFDHMQIQGISEAEDFFYSNYASRNRHYKSAIKPQSQIIKMDLAHNIHVGMRYVHEPTEINWNAVDANPSYSSQKIESLEDMVHFKKLNQDTKEIILQRASMEEVLHFALAKQSDRQEEIREEMIKRKGLEKYKQNTDVKAELRLVA